MIGEPRVSRTERERLRMSLTWEENRLSELEKAKIRYRMEAETPYPDDAEWALFNDAGEQGTDWVPLGEKFRQSEDAEWFTATKIGIRVLRFRSCSMSVGPGMSATVELPATSWAEYAARHGIREDA